MPDQKISDLGDGGAPQPTDDFVIARGTTNNKIAWSSMSAGATAGNIALTAAGNTAGALALVSSGTVTLAGGNNITLSQAGNAITISGAAAAGAQTAISGIAASNTTYTSGTVTLTGVGGGVTVSSNTGQRVDISVAAPVAQTVQTQNVHNVTLSGNTAGVMAQVSSGTLTLAGGNNITVSQNGNAVTISGANVGGAQTGISGVAASNTTYTSGSVTFSGVGGGVTVSSNTGQRVDISVAAQSVQPETQTFISGISASNTLYTSGQVRFTGSQAVTVRSGTGQLVVIDAPAQTTQTQGILSAGVSTGGNTAGNTQVSTGSRLVLAGAGNISLSQATAAGASTISISGSQSVQPETQTFIGGIQNSQTTYTSGTVNLSVVAGQLTIRSTTGQAFQFSASQSVQPETQTAISGIANSQTTYTSGTVSLSELGAITIRSTTGNQYQFSVNSQTVQTQNMVAVTLSGNTSGAQALISSGTMTLAGGNNITVSQAGNAVTISGPNVGGAQTGISGIANSETTYTSGTVSLSELGAITIRSTTGNQYQLSVNAQSVQPETQTFLAGIQNSQTTYTSGTVNLSVVAGNLTIRSTTGQAFQFSMSQTVQPETQTAISGIANSQTTYTSGTVSLSELGAITIRSTTGNQFQFSVNSQTAQTGISGIANSQTTYTSGTVSMSELGAITIRSTTGNQYQFSVNAQTTQTQGILSMGVSTGGNTAGNTTVNTGSRMVLVGLGEVSLSQATAAGASTISISAPAQTVQTQGGFLSAGVSTGGNTLGNTQVSTGSRLVFVGSGMITASQATAAGASTITLNATQSVQPETQTFIAGIIASDTTYTSGNVRFTGVGGGVTVSSNTGQRVDISVAAPVAATNLSVGASNVGNTAGDTTVNTGSRLVFAGGNNITISQGTAAGATTLTISAPNLGAGAFSGGASNLGNTAGATGITGTQLVLVGSGAVSLSQTTGANGGTLSILAPATSSLSATGIVSLSTNGSTVSVGAPAYSGGMSTMGNTAGDTGYASQRLNLAGGNNITLSGSTNAGSMTITISAGAGGAGGIRGGVSTGGNTAGSTGTISTGNMVLVGVSPVSLSQSTGAAGSDATVSILAPATSLLSATGDLTISTNGSTVSIGAPLRPMYDWQNMAQGEAQLQTHIASISKTPFYWHEALPWKLTANSLAFKVSFVTANTLASLSAHLGIYTFVNSTSMALLGSMSEAYVISSATSASFSGVRHLVMTGIGTHAALSNLPAGNYGFGMMFSAGATASMNASLMGASTANGPLGMIFPGTNSVSTGTSQGALPLWGRGSTTVNAMPANVVRSELVNQGSGASVQLHPWIYIRS